MVDVIIRSAEGCAPDPFLLWDSIWSQNDGAADWALAGVAEKLNRGGLAAHRALDTAVTLCLFTDKRVPKDHPLAWLADGDPRGWWGDGVDVRTDLNETALGSLLWLLERAPLDDQTAQWARQLALEALAPLLAQRAVARIDAQAVANPMQSRVELTVQFYGADGSNVYDRKFDLIWKQLQA
jgi:phage gp46-like protein